MTSKFSIKSVVFGILGIALLLLVFRRTNDDTDGYYLHVYDPDHCLTLKVYPGMAFSSEWHSGKISIRGNINMRNADPGEFVYQYRNGSNLRGRRKFRLDTMMQLPSRQGYFVISKSGSPGDFVFKEDFKIDGKTGATF